MPIVIQSKTRYIGTVTPQNLQTETTIINLDNQSDDYIIEGYIDLANLQADETVILREYIAVDGTNQRKFIETQYTGILLEPVIRFHAKTIPYNGKYKVTITQMTGSIRSFPYAFILEVMGTI